MEKEKMEKEKMEKEKIKKRTKNRRNIKLRRNITLTIAIIFSVFIIGTTTYGILSSNDAKTETSVEAFDIENKELTEEQEVEKEEEIDENVIILMLQKKMIKMKIQIKEIIM